MKSSRAFTFSELIIVVVVAFILLALLFPAVTSVGRIRKAHAKNDVTQIATACAAYGTEYGHLPGTNETMAEVRGDLLASLMGSNTPTVANPRRIVFLEVNPAKRDRSGLKDDTFVDPWGQVYKVAFRRKLRWQNHRRRGRYDQHQPGSVKEGRRVERPQPARRV